MPIYEYQCKACEHVFDVLQKLSDEPLTYCPECGKPELRKLLSAPNFRLKGGGWYETDFKDKNKRNLAGDSSSSASGASGTKIDVGGGKSDGKGEGKSDAKPATGNSGASAGSAAD